MINIRKSVVNVETIYHEGGPKAATPLKVGVAAVVINNPYAGRYEENILPLMEEMVPLGQEMALTLLDSLGGNPGDIQVYGKASMAGVNGEIEHAALWHAPGGGALRKLLKADAFVPSAKTVASAGVRLMIPMLYINTVWVRSHYSMAELSIHDAPRPNELVLALAMGTGGRIHARIGGLSIKEALEGKIP